MNAKGFDYKTVYEEYKQIPQTYRIMLYMAYKDTIIDRDSPIDPIMKLKVIKDTSYNYLIIDAFVEALAHLGDLSLVEDKKEREYLYMQIQNYAIGKQMCNRKELIEGGEIAYSFSVILFKILTAKLKKTNRNTPVYEIYQQCFDAVDQLKTEINIDVKYYPYILEYMQAEESYETNVALGNVYYEDDISELYDEDEYDDEDVEDNDDEEFDYNKDYS